MLGGGVDINCGILILTSTVIGNGIGGRGDDNGEIGVIYFYPGGENGDAIDSDIGGKIGDGGCSDIGGFSGEGGGVELSVCIDIVT